MGKRYKELAKEVREIIKADSGLEEAVAGAFARRYEGTSIMVQYRDLKALLKRHEQRLITNHLFLTLIVDPLIREVEMLRKAKSNDLMFQEFRLLLYIYLDYDCSVSMVEGDGRPLDEHSEEGARLLRIDKLYQGLSRSRRLEMYGHLIRKSKALKRDDHWMLLDFSQHLYLGRAERLKGAVESDHDDDGNYGDIALFEALYAVAQMMAR